MDEYRVFEYDTPNSGWGVASVTGNLVGGTPTNPTVNGVASVTWLNTDNTDPANPVVEISVDWVTITGSWTPWDPLVSNWSWWVQSVSGSNVDNSDPLNPVIDAIVTDGTTITGTGLG